MGMKNTEATNREAQRAAARQPHEAKVGFVAPSGRIYCAICGRRVDQSAEYYRTGRMVHR